MADTPQKYPFYESLKNADIRLFIGTLGFFTLASRALVVVIGFQVYKLTHSALALGWLGLIEAIPAISLVLFGGYVADHFNRRKILLITGAVSFLCAVVLAVLSLEGAGTSLAGLYAVVFAAGMARAFSDPATTAFEAQVVPKALSVNAASWVSSIWITSMVLGPAIIGFVFDAGGAFASYVLIAAGFLLSLLCFALIPPKAQPMPEQREPVFKSIAIGWRFVFSHEPLLAALALDLFAVLFGGAIALLPIYAESILHVGGKGLGLLNAAPSLGSLLVMLIATHHPPMARAGRNLLIAVGGFGVCMLIFAFSKNFWLSMLMLALSGAFDGISVVIRRTMLRLLSPDDMRGRIAAANWVFVSASNELGAFESGMLAAWIGTVPCVAVGGVVTLGIVGFTALFAKQLRGLRFDMNTMDEIKSQE